MGNFFTNTHKVILLFSLLVFGCFNSESSSEDKILLAKSQDAVLDSIFQNYDSSIEDLNKNISNIYQKIQNNTTLINSMNDSMRVFQQIDISGNTSDKDIINSLIRIQSKFVANSGDIEIQEILYTMEINCKDNTFRDIATGSKKLYEFKNKNSKWNNPKGDKLINGVIYQVCRDR